MTAAGQTTQPAQQPTNEPTKPRCHIDVGFDVTVSFKMTVSHNCTDYIEKYAGKLKILLASDLG